jgi:hypothetical protein
LVAVVDGAGEPSADLAGLAAQVQRVAVVVVDLQGEAAVAEDPGGCRGW